MRIAACQLCSCSAAMPGANNWWRERWRVRSACRCTACQLCFCRRRPQTLRLWQRESMLLPLALYLDTMGYGAESVAAGSPSPVTRLLERVEGAVFLDARESWPGLHKSTVTVDVAKPSAAEQVAAWQSALGLAAK